MSDALPSSSAQASLPVRVRPFLSLDQVRSFTFARNPYYLCLPGREDHRCQELPGTTEPSFADGRLSIDLLVFDLRGHPSPADRPLATPSRPIDTQYIVDRWDVLALFDPKELRVLGDPLLSQVSNNPTARKALDAYAISAGDCDPDMTLSLMLLRWTHLERVTLVNTLCYNLAYLKVPKPGQNRVNVVVDVSRQDMVKVSDTTSRWSKEPRKPAVTDEGQHSAVTSALVAVKRVLRAERINNKPGWLDTSLLGHVTILVANEEQVKEAETLISWHERTSLSKRGTPEFFNLITSGAAGCVFRLSSTRFLSWGRGAKC